MTSTSTHRHRRMAICAAALAATVTLAPLAATTVSAAPRAAAAQATARSFQCTGIISRDYTRQTVTGTLIGVTPSAVSVQNYVGSVVHTKATPNKANRWWGGLYKRIDHLNQWNLGAAADSTIYHLMLPETRPGAAFQGVLVSEFGGGAQGNWQNHMDCTAA